MPVRVDEAGHDDAVRSVDDIGVADLERGADGGDPSVLDEDVAVEHVPELAIHRQDVAATEENTLGHGISLRCAVSAPVNAR